MPHSSCRIFEQDCTDSTSYKAGAPEKQEEPLRSLQVFRLQLNVVLAGMLLASVLFLCLFVAVNTIRFALKVCRVLSSCRKENVCFFSATCVYILIAVLKGST